MLETIRLEQLLKENPYGLNKDEKRIVYQEYLNELTHYHYDHCREYKNILDFWEIDLDKKIDTLNIPMLPVRLFKEYDLLSIKPENVLKIMTSSGTTGQRVSKIFLDRANAINQTKVLNRIVSDFIGSKRLPMIVIDSKSVLKDRNMFSARGAGILGFSIFGREILYALDDEMNLDISGLKYFCDKHKGKPILLFGFTYMLWEYFYKPISKNKYEIDLSDAILFHGGGWKKMISESIDNETFKIKLKEACKIQKIYNYYGMVEQTGSIFVECQEGHLHCSNFSDIVVRRNDLSICDYGEEGLIQLISLIPSSYPGHSILTEDLGVILGEDDCLCGRKGKYFKISGRVKLAEVRGCSDTYEK